MSFFFAEAMETNSKSKKKQIPLNTAKALGCKVCPLKSEALNPSIAPEGAIKAAVYFLSDFPEMEDDKANKPYSGPAGQLIRQNISSRWKDQARFNSVVRSFPKLGRKPEEVEIECCKQSIISDIEQSEPTVIVAVGTLPLEWLLDQRDLAKWRGRFVPAKIGSHYCWVYPIYSPKHLFFHQRVSSMGKSIPSEYDYIFELDFKNLWNQIGNLTPAKDSYLEQGYLQRVYWTEGLKADRELEKVKQWLKELAKADFVGVDYETSCLRPFEKNSKVLSIAIADKKQSVSFPLEYPGAWTTSQYEELRTALITFFKSPAIKICHNVKFEMEWTGSRFGTDLLYTNTWACTQAQAYVLDERRGMLSLDILIRLNFGFWLKSLSNLDRSRMLDHPLEKILPYNGLDSKWTLELFHIQASRLKSEPKLQKTYEMLMTTAATLAATQIRGIVLDYNNHSELLKQTNDELASIETAIGGLSEVMQFKDRFGISFNPGSPDHVLRCLKNIMGLDEQLKKDNGKYSTDESILATLTDVELAKLILDYRGISKKISTYLEPYPQYVLADGRIHTNFNPYETSTGRLCVAKGTMIEVVRDFSKLPLGVAVEDVKPGDLVYTYNDQLQVTLKPVTWSGITGHKKVLRIHWKGDGNKTSGYLDVTCNHPIRLINGDYVRADQLCVNDRVLSMTKHCPNNHKIIKIEWLKDTVDVYDLGVEDTHNFIANGICVSNSSSDPNLQNVPSRTGKELRRMIGVPDNHFMVCSDYGQIEARIIGVASQDEAFCEALWEDYDVHMEWAKLIAEEYPKVIGGSQNLSNPGAMKKFRAKVKNLWVFPAFYGASPNSIARGLGIPIDIVQDIFREFWKTFRGVKRWQKWILNRYEKLGYVETLTGRRRHAPMSMNAVLNASIQGFASDICVDAMCRLDRLGIQTVMIIHDDVTSYVHDDDLDTIVPLIAEEMCKVPYPFINVPIAIEMTAGLNWFDQSEIGTFKSTEFHPVSRELQDFTKLYDFK